MSITNNRTSKEKTSSKLSYMVNETINITKIGLNIILKIRTIFFGKLIWELVEWLESQKISTK